MSNRIPIEELESYLWGSAQLLRTNIDAGAYKQYIFPLLFFKRICDVYDEETQNAFYKYGDDAREFSDDEIHTFIVPRGYHWNDVREAASDVGLAIVTAFRKIEKANGDKLTGVFGDAAWTNKNRLPDRLLKDIIEHFSSKTLSIANCPEDELGQGYEYLIKKFADDSGHTAQEFYTNRTVVHLMTEMLKPQGKTCSGIAEYLKSNGVLTPSGKSNNWTKNTVYSILTNEKYKGDALLQKTYTADYLEHRLVPNKGELPQYYVENSHPAIIEKEIWEMVQTELMRRSMIGAAYSGSSVFVSKLVCGDCGKLYGKKKWHSTDKYTKEIYRCNDKYNKSHEQCKTPILTEEQIKEKFIKAYNQVMCKKEMVIEDTLAAIDLLTNTDELDIRILELQHQLEDISQKVSTMVKENARTVQDQIEFARKYDALTSEYEEVKNAYDKACKEKAYKTGKATKMRAYLGAMKQANTYLDEWSNEMWVLMVSRAIVNRDGSIKFEFMNGQEVTI